MRKFIALAAAAIVLGTFTVIPQVARAEEGDVNTNASKATIEELKKRNELKRKRRMEALAAKQTTGTAMSADKSAATDITTGTKM
ncbi:MAG: hypothetical protein ACR2IE_15525 [Candidatus Sumerlaeaceae bacterium]